MREFENGVNNLNDEHFAFIELECGVSKDDILSFDDDQIDKLVYDPLCDIETEELPAADGESESERCVIASEIVTILGNSLAEANGWLDESEE